jgi:predicted DNA-binding transcriptional regulator AlpA
MVPPESARRPLQGAPRGESARESAADATIVGEDAQQVQLEDEPVDEKPAVRFEMSLFCEPLLVDAIRAATLCGISERTWRKLDRTVRVPRPVEVGRRRLWSVQDLRAWVAAGCPSRERWEGIGGDKL